MIGVCIKYFHENYGGMLQAYATTLVLDNIGVDYELIRYSKRLPIFKKIKYIPRLFNSVLINDKKEAIKQKIGRILHIELKKNNGIRMKAFHIFCENNFSKLSKVYSSYRELSEESIKYDIVLTGSDQLWSPAGLPTNFYNLQFCNDKVKRISYASSFGVNFIPWYQKRRTKNYLNKIHCISMREISGAEIVKKLTGKNVPVVLDPVFLLTKEQWNNAIGFERRIKEKYIFAYFLGSNSRYRVVVNKFAKEKKLKIVTLRHLDQYVKEDEKFGDYAPYDIAPDDFLNLIRNAEYIVTDSFHGSAFSIIYEKKFLTFNRYSDKSKVSKNSRIETLMANFNLSRRYNGNIYDIEHDIDYSLIKEKLDAMRKVSLNYLLTALEKTND